MNLLIVFCFVLILLSFISVIIYSIYRLVQVGAVLPIVEYLEIKKGLTLIQKNILKNKFPYYANLSPYDKIQFEQRLKYFLFNKQFIAKDMPSITEEMKILVGASAVQLTFGYSPLKFPRFSKIILFPGSFYSKGSARVRIGEVNPYAEAIVLSWKDFIKGYKIETDGRNVGLHEMAHALKLEDATMDEEYAFLDDDELKNFYEISQEEFAKIKRGEPSFLRAYAGTNMEEFFAVSVEYFFEQPEEFRKQLPDIYASLSRLLHQNPAQSSIHN